MNEANLKTVIVELEAYNKKDIETFITTLSQNCEVYRDNELLAKGLDEVRKLYTDLFKKFEHLKATITKREFEADDIIDYESIELDQNTAHFIVRYSFDTNNKILKMDIRRC